MAEPQTPSDRRLEDRETSSPRQAFAQRSEPPSTDLVRLLIELARKYAAAKGSSFASTHSLLAAVLAVGKDEPQTPHAPAWWWETLEPYREALEQAVASLYSHGLGDPERLLRSTQPRLT